MIFKPVIFDCPKAFNYYFNRRNLRGTVLGVFDCILAISQKIRFYLSNAIVISVLQSLIFSREYYRNLQFKYVILDFLINNQYLVMGWQHIITMVSFAHTIGMCNLGELEWQEGYTYEKPKLGWKSYRFLNQCQFNEAITFLNKIQNHSKKSSNYGSISKIWGKNHYLEIFQFVY